MQVLKCFSAVDNFRYWLSAKASANDEITCLHGLKALTSLSLPCLHTAGLVFALSRPIDQENMIKVSFFVNINSYFKSIVDFTYLFIVTFS